MSNVKCNIEVTYYPAKSDAREAVREVIRLCADAGLTKSDINHINMKPMAVQEPTGVVHIWETEVSAYVYHYERPEKIEREDHYDYPF